MKAKRLPYIDALAGIMIAWMILGHCGHFSQFKIPFHRFLSFYMPWFFYKSGAFFIIKDSSELFKKDIGKYLRVFIVYSLLGWFVWSACGLMDGTLSIRDIFIMPVLTFVKYGCVAGGNGALWFLLTLFFVRQASNVVLRKVPPPIFGDCLFFNRICIE